MINFFAEIFEATGDQARLVTTLIAAVIAVVVVLANQWFNSRRARKEKIIEKIEEAFSITLSIQEKAQAQHTKIVTDFDEIQQNAFDAVNRLPGSSLEYKDVPHEYHLEIIRAGRNLVMLSQLYFPSIEGNVAKAMGQYQEIYSSYVSAEKLDEYLDFYKGASKELHVSLDKLYEELSSVMKRAMH